MLTAVKARFLGEGHESEVLRGAAVAFLLRGMGAALAFALNVVIGRLLGAEGAGLYFLALSIVTIASVVTRFGLDLCLLRFVAAAAAIDDWARVKGVYSLGMRLGAVSAFLAAVLIVAFAPQLASYGFGQPDLGPVLRVMGMATFGLTMMTLGSESLKGLKRIAASVAVAGIIFPLIALVLIWPLVDQFGASGAAAAYAAGVTVSAAIGWGLWHWFVRERREAKPHFALAELWESSRALWVMQIVTKAVMPWAALLILGFMAPPEEAGIFGAAARIAGLVTFLLLTVNTVISPKFGELHAKSEVGELGRIARRFALLVFLAASPLLLILIFAGGFVMSIFGPDFVRGGTALAILAMGQAVSALCGSAGSLLIMTGHVREVRTAALVGGASVVALSFAFIPQYGLVGAAVATAVSVAAMNIMYVVQIKRELGIFVIPLGRA